MNILLTSVAFLTNVRFTFTFTSGRTRFGPAREHRQSPNGEENESMQLNIQGKRREPAGKAGKGEEKERKRK